VLLAVALNAVALPSLSAQTADARPLRHLFARGPEDSRSGPARLPAIPRRLEQDSDERGAIVDGSLHFPTPQELANVDVMFTYKGDAGGVNQPPSDEEKATLEAFLKRGGGILRSTTRFARSTRSGCLDLRRREEARPGQLHARSARAYTIADPAHPIMQGMTDFTISDESFFLMTWQNRRKSRCSPPHRSAHAERARSRNEVVPQIWTYERTIGDGKPYRAFVWMQGHNYVNFTHAQVQPMLLRALAWAGRAPIDSLLTVRAGRGGAGGGGRDGGRHPRAVLRLRRRPARVARLRINTKLGRRAERTATWARDLDPRDRRAVGSACDRSLRWRRV